MNKPAKRQTTTLTSFQQLEGKVNLVTKSHPDAAPIQMEGKVKMVPKPTTLNPQRKLVSFDEFEATLKEHNWSFNAQSFYGYARATRYEEIMFSTAVAHGIEHTLLYLLMQKTAIADITAAAMETALVTHKAEMKALTDAFSTSDADFNAFCLLLAQHNWHYDLEADCDIWNAGHEQYKVIMNIVEDKGGKYETQYVLAKAKNSLQAHSGS